MEGLTTCHHLSPARKGSFYWSCVLGFRSGLNPQLNCYHHIYGGLNQMSKPSKWDLTNSYWICSRHSRQSHWGSEEKIDHVDDLIRTLQSAFGNKQRGPVWYTIYHHYLLQKRATFKPLNVHQPVGIWDIYD